MRQRRIHFHSDCAFFAGCENMLANFFSSPAFTGNHEVSFSYRYSPDYEAGFKKRVPAPPGSTFPLILFDTAMLYLYLNTRLPQPIRLGAKVLINVLLLKYWAVAYDAVVLYRLFKGQSIDLLHINNGGYPGADSCTAAVIAARLAGIGNIVYVVNNLAVPYTAPPRWLDYPLDRLVAGLTSVFVTGSAFAREKLTAVLHPPKATNIHNGIGPRELTETRGEVRARLGIAEDRVVILVVAVLEERKGHTILLKALQQLKEGGHGRPPLVVIEGSGPTRPLLEDQALSAALTDDVRFIGTEDSVFNVINAVDIVALPSIANEDLPNIVLEAMSLGKPVIASRMAGIPEQIDHMETGVLVSPGDAGGLAEAMRFFTDRPESIVEFGEKGRRKFQAGFTIGTAVARYEALYQQLWMEEIR